MRPLLASQPNTRALGLAGLVALLSHFFLLTPLEAQSPGGEPTETYEKALHFPLSIPEFDAEIPETGKLWVVTVNTLEASMASEATQVSIPSEQLNDFMVYLSNVRSTRERLRCNISPVVTGLKPFSGDKPVEMEIMDYIMARNLVFLGEIEQIAPAWDLHYKTAVAIVFVRIEEVLKDEGNDFSVGSLVTYEKPWGEVTILGIPFCTDPPPDAPTDGSPHVGQQIILTGSKDLRNPNHLVTHHSGILPVVDGVVSPPAGDPRFSPGTASLESVRESLR